ncbi:MAG: hypothetical protein AAF215_27160 [Cyanobacteria bacterium P01_A01_bin.123]
MALKYTTSDAIQRRLDGRLQVDGQATSWGDSVISAELVEQVGGQVEAKIDEILRRKWVMPLTGTHPQLAMIVELGCVCQLLSQHFLSQTPSETGGYTPQACSLYKAEIKGLSDLMLEGETLLQPATQTATGRVYSSQAIAHRLIPSEVQDVKW